MLSHPHKLKRPDVEDTHKCLQNKENQEEEEEVDGEKATVRKKISWRRIMMKIFNKERKLVVLCVHGTERVCPLIKHSIVIVTHCLNPT